MTNEVLTNGTSSIPVTRHKAGRSDIPENEEQRRLFGVNQRIVERLSFHPQKKEGAEYVLQLEDAVKILKDNIKELVSRDPMIPLTLALKQPEWDPSRGDKRIGSYRLINPSIKQLNDIYLGPDETDRFMKDLQEEIDGVLGRHGAKALHNQFKGGAFLIDIENIEEDGDKNKIAVLEEKLGEIQHVAKQKLLDHLRLRKEKLNHKQLELDGKITLADERLSLPQSEDEKREIEKEQEKLTEQRELLTANLREVRKMIREITTETKTVDITIGLGKVRPGKLENYAAIHNAEAGANIATLQKSDPSVLNGNGKKNGVPHVYLREYKDEDLVYYGLKAILRTTREVLGKDYEVRPEWQKFFEVEDGNVLMNLGMIQLYRKLDKYRDSQEYQAMSDDEKTALDQQFTSFDRHYKSINIVDVLRNFRIENFESYLQTVQYHVDLLERSQELLEKYENAPEGKIEAKHEEDLREILSWGNELLKYSLKSDPSVGNVVYTVHGVMEKLMQPGKKVIAFIDAKNIGPKNARSNEKKLIELIDFINITAENILATGGESEKIKAMVSQKVEDAGKDPEFLRRILSFNDEITKEIRKIEEQIGNTFGGKGIVANWGGDEMLVVYHENSVPEIRNKTNAEVLEAIRDASIEGNFRAAVRIEDGHIEASPEIGKISEEMRKSLIRWNKTTDGFILAIPQIKANEQRGKQEVLTVS